MSEFNGVTIVREANIYFDGKVTSRTVLFPDGTRKTLGVMLAGEYSFDTDAAELMEVLGGEMEVRLPGSSDWNTYKAGDSYEVAANAAFDLVIKDFADYCCSYLQG